MDNVISQAAFEFTIEKMQQTIRRQLIAIIVLITLFALTVGGMIFAFIRYESQFSTDYLNVNSDKGSAFYSYIGEDGEISYGESNS